MPVRPSFSLGERADFGFGLGDALRRGKALLRRVFATDLLTSISLSRVTTHVQCDDFPTSSPMTILAFSVVPWWYPPIGGPIGGPLCDAYITRLWRPPPLLVNRIIMRRVYSAMGGIMTGMTGCVVSPGRTLPMCGSIAPLASASDR